MKQFVPLTDELLYDDPARISGPVVPFERDYECFHWLRLEMLEQKHVGEHNNEEHGAVEYGI